jgi:nucleoside-diphosphate-sugar epimerase
MNNLVIGNTSQLSNYFPEGYEKISSRNIDFEFYKNKIYDRVFLCFAEQRTFLENSTPDIFSEINVHYTLKLVEFFKDKCNKIVVYGTSELWNNYDGPVNIENEFKFNNTPYIVSKMVMSQIIKKQYDNAIIVHPFNFNSIYRKSGFLFGKIFDSILNNNRIEIGDTYFYRDLVHPKYVVERSIKCTEDELVGSGRLFFVNDFIRDLYKGMGMNYDDYVSENHDHDLSNTRKTYYLKNKKCLYSYNNLLEDTLTDIKKCKNTK